MKLEIDTSDLKPLIEQTVSETISQLGEMQTQQPRQLAYPEDQAAALLGVKPHVLRDARRRGEVQASKVGSRIVYTEASLLRFLEQNRWDH